MPAIAGGLGKDQVVIGWFGSTNASDPNDTKAQWRYYAATSFDGGKTFSQSVVTPDVIHYGDICTQGVFCGLIPGEPSNRNLADFSSAAVDPATGCAIFAIPRDPYNRPDLPNGANTFDSSAYISRQVGGPCLAAATTAGAAALPAPVSAARGPAPSPAPGPGRPGTRRPPRAPGVGQRRHGQLRVGRGPQRPAPPPPHLQQRRHGRRRRRLPAPRAGTRRSGPGRGRGVRLRGPRAPHRPRGPLRRLPLNCLRLVMGIVLV